jgi:hypothetical protein
MQARAWIAIRRLPLPPGHGCGDRGPLARAAGHAQRRRGAGHVRHGRWALRLRVERGQRQHPARCQRRWQRQDVRHSGAAARQPAAQLPRTQARGEAPPHGPLPVPTPTAPRAGGPGPAAARCSRPAPRRPHCPAAAVLLGQLELQQARPLPQQLLGRQHQALEHGAAGLAADVPWAQLLRLPGRMVGLRCRAGERRRGRCVCVGGGALCRRRRALPLAPPPWPSLAGPACLAGPVCLAARQLLPPGRQGPLPSPGRPPASQQAPCAPPFPLPRPTGTRSTPTSSSPPLATPRCGCGTCGSPCPPQSSRRTASRWAVCSPSARALWHARLPRPLFRDESGACALSG